MLAKSYRKSTREETAVFVARSTISRAYLGTPFSDDELREVVNHVELSYGIFDQHPDQFHAVVAALALHMAKAADRYGAHGYDDDREIAGRSSVRYWLDHTYGENNLGVARWVAETAKLPPECFEIDMSPEPKSSARCCSGLGAKHKFGVGEPRLTLALWEPSHGQHLDDPWNISRRRLVTCCLEMACVKKFEREHGVSISNAVPASHLGVEALAAVEKRQDELIAAKIEGAPQAPPKSNVCFPKDRKREVNSVECDGNPWGELELDMERVAAEGARRVEEVKRLHEEQAPAFDAAEAKRLREARDEADEHRKKRYRPTLDAHKDAVVDEANPLCAYVFEKDPDGEKGPFKCPYDRIGATPFCLQCKKMVELLNT
tara:strand:+ start:851 stop:1975 length:1125 start_codon:yes stop_codon:yes gene_type:complete